MMKHAMWMAFEHRRRLLGFDGSNGGGEALLNAVEACSSADEQATDTEAEKTDDTSLGEGEKAEEIAGTALIRHGCGTGLCLDMKSMGSSAIPADASPEADRAPATRQSQTVSTAENHIDAPTDVAPNDDGGPGVAPEATTAKNYSGPKLRMKNDTFYDDYLHRGDLEPGQLALEYRKRYPGVLPGGLLLGDAGAPPGYGEVG